MIDLAALAALASGHEAELARPVAPVRIGDRIVDTDTEPVLMGVVNLSRDSTYRESIAVDVDAAIRMGRVQAAQGAHLIDLGAESSRATAELVAPADQANRLTPVIAALSAEGIVCSIEGYHPELVRSGLEAGAQVVNLTGSGQDDAMFALAAEHGATVIMCHVLGEHARALDGSEVQADPIPEMLDSFGARLAAARAAGVEHLIIDPGLGFGFRLDDQVSRAKYQAAALLNTFRLRRLGVPICHAMPHAFDLFEDQFRSAEGVFAVLAHLGGTGVYRNHEIALVRSVLRAMSVFSTDGSD